MADFENVQPDEYKMLGRNFTPGRPWGITSVTIHHMAGDLDADACNRVWRNSGTSAHYSIDRNGKIVQHVNDTDRAWACGDGVGVNSGGNDRSISIEHANCKNGPWLVHDAAIESGAHLVAALCRYYKLGRPQWGKNVFPHRHWKSTACPGELAGSQNARYMRRAQEWYDAMCGGKPAPKPQPSTAHRVKVTAPVLNIRRGPGTDSPIVGKITDRGVYTVTSEAPGPGSSKWGKLKSGAGWIALDLTERV